MHYFSNLFDKVLYMLQTGPLSIIRSISTLCTRNRYLSCQFCWLSASVVRILTVLADSQQNQHDIPIACAQCYPLTHDNPYSVRTAPLTSKRCILYIYSTNIDTEYFKHGIYSSFFSLQNAVCFIILMYLVPVSFTFYIQGVLNFKKIIPAPKG